MFLILLRKIGALVWYSEFRQEYRHRSVLILLPGPKLIGSSQIVVSGCLKASFESLLNEVVGFYEIVETVAVISQGSIDESHEQMGIHRLVGRKVHAFRRRIASVSGVRTW